MWRVRLYDEPKTLYLPTWVQTIKQQMELGNRRLQIYTTVTEKKNKTIPITVHLLIKYLCWGLKLGKIWHRSSTVCSRMGFPQSDTCIPGSLLHQSFFWCRVFVFVFWRWWHVFSLHCFFLGLFRLAGNFRCCLGIWSCCRNCCFKHFRRTCLFLYFHFVLTWRCARSGR